jgi:hypothetical protein
VAGGKVAGDNPGAQVLDGTVVQAGGHVDKPNGIFAAGTASWKLWGAPAGQRPTLAVAPRRSTK